MHAVVHFSVGTQVPLLCEGLNAFVKFLACVCIFVWSGVGAGLSDCFVPPLTYAKKQK